MAIDESGLAKSFWPRVKRRIIVASVLIQLAGLLVIALLLYVTEFYLYGHAFVTAAITAAVLIAITTTLTIVICHFSARPLRDLLAAIVHIAGEPTATPPPNPNDAYYQKTGLKPALEELYKLSAASHTPTQTEVQNTGLATVLTDALNATPTGFVVMNKSGAVAFSNNAAPIRITQDGTTQLALLFNETDTISEWVEASRKTAVSAERVWTRIPDKLPDDEERRFFDVFASYRNGVENEVVLTLVDRTAAYSAGEEDLDFIAFAAHELRGPITVIRGYLDVLESELDGVMLEDHHELFRRLTVSANRLSGYINNILNTSRYDRRHLKMHLAETTVASIYAMIRDDMQLRASSQNRLLTVAIPEDLPTIAADTNSLSEVFSNLIDNAIKYSPEGSTIAVSAVKNGDAVQIAVQDHGIGMPGNVVSNLFQKFYRSHRSRETVAGTGIGLYISKAIVESHGGTISVKSEEGKGSTFTVSLPTYASVSAKLAAGDNQQVITKQEGWIKNHSMYRG